jgi:hypothetical protein
MINCKWMWTKVAVSCLKARSRYSAAESGGNHKICQGGGLSPGRGSTWTPPDYKVRTVTD